MTEKINKGLYDFIVLATSIDDGLVQRGKIHGLNDASTENNKPKRRNKKKGK